MSDDNDKLLRPRAGALNKLRCQVEGARSGSRRTESLLLLLDGSGSMAGASWNGLREAVQRLAEASDPAVCRMGLAIFHGSSADVYRPFTAHVEGMRDALDVLPPGGGTPMRQGLELAQSLTWPSEFRRGGLLSDGMPTSGDPLPAAKRLATMGVVIDTVGCGHCDEIVLRAIAAVTGGRYVYCAQINELVGTFRSLETRARGLLGPKGSP